MGTKRQYITVLTILVEDCMRRLRNIGKSFNDFSFYLQHDQTLLLSFLNIACLTINYGTGAVKNFNV